MTSVSTQSTTQADSTILGSQSKLLKQVVSSNVDRVERALKTASANEVASAIRKSNEIVAREVNGGTSGFRPLQIDALLRAKMSELDAKNPVLNEVIADGAKSAAELQGIRDRAMAESNLAAAARRPAFEATIKSLAADGERIRVAQHKMAAAVNLNAAEPKKQVLLDLKNGRAPSRSEIDAYNRALQSAKTVEITVNGGELWAVQKSAARAAGTYHGEYSSIAGFDTDRVESLKITIVD